MRFRAEKSESSVPLLGGDPAASGRFRPSASRGVCSINRIEARVLSAARYGFASHRIRDASILGAAGRRIRRMLHTFALLPLLAATVEELREASEALQAGDCDSVCFDIFQRAALQNPNDWRTHAMLGQAQGQRGMHGPAVAALRTAQKLSPVTPEVKLALASELRRSGGPERTVLVEIADLYRAALTPGGGASALRRSQQADIYANLGHILAEIRDLKASAENEERIDAAEGIEAVAAWSASIALAPKDPRCSTLHILIATRLTQAGDASQRPRAIKAAERAVKLAPTSAEAYNALGSAFFTGLASAAAISSKHRQRATQALKTAIELWESHVDGDQSGGEDGSRPKSGSGRGVSSSSSSSSRRGDDDGGEARASQQNVTAVSRLQARAHSMLSRLLSSHPELQKLGTGSETAAADPAAAAAAADDDDGDNARRREQAAGFSEPNEATRKDSPPLAALSDEGGRLMRDAVAHLRAAARLDPVAYSDAAKRVTGWEDAERQYKQADAQSLREREAMVMAMHAEVEGRRQETEEDAEVKREEAGLAARGFSDTRIRYDYEKKAARRKGRSGTEAPKDEV